MHLTRWTFAIVHYAPFGAHSQETLAMNAGDEFDRPSASQVQWRVMTGVLAVFRFPLMTTAPRKNGEGTMNALSLLAAARRVVRSS